MFKIETKTVTQCTGFKYGDRVVLNYKELEGLWGYVYRFFINTKLFAIEARMVRDIFTEYSNVVRVKGNEVELR